MEMRIHALEKNVERLTFIITLRSSSKAIDTDKLPI